MSLVLVLAAAAAGGLLAQWVGIPGGLIVGAMVGAAAMQLTRGGGAVHVPDPVQAVSFLILGAAIGSSITRDTLTALRAALVPAVLASVLIIVAGVLIALLLRRLDMAPAGDVLATSPGNLSAIIAIAAERKTGAAEVALFHTVRVILVLVSVPALLALLPGDR